MLLRILTALVLAPLVVLATVMLPNWAFAGSIGAIFLLGFREWHELLARSTWEMVISALVMIVIMVLAQFSGEILYGIAAIGAVYWLIQLVVIKSDRTLHRNALGGRLESMLVIIAAWSALVLLHRHTQYGPVMTIGLMAVVWSADSFAYFVGKAFGRRKLAPKISPGKTVEGVVGGAVGAVLFSIAFCFFSPFFSLGDSILWCVLTFFAALVSVVGDLYESRLKRSAGAKDSGTLLPGHGGVLDRVDGLLAAAPFFVAVFLI